MALHHASSGELIDIRPLGPDFGREVTRALYKSDRLEVFRTILAAGEETPAHQVAGEVTIQCLEGTIDLACGATTRTMRGGDLVCLAGGERHAIKAVENASVLVTMLLHGA